MRRRGELLAALAGALGGLTALAAVALADGIERRQRPPQQQAEAAEPLEAPPEEHDLLGGPIEAPAIVAPQAEPVLPMQAQYVCPTYEEALAMVQRATDGADIDQIDAAIAAAIAEYEDCETIQLALARAQDFVEIARLPDMPQPISPARPLLPLSEPPGDPPGGGGGPGYPGT